MLSSSYACEFYLRSTENFLGCQNWKGLEKTALTMQKYYVKQNTRK